MDIQLLTIYKVQENRTFVHFYKKTGLEKGFQFVESAPMVRSSYHAIDHIVKNQ